MIGEIRHKGNFKRKAKKGLALFACLCMTSALFPVSSVQADFDNNNYDGYLYAFEGTTLSYEIDKDSMTAKVYRIPRNSDGYTISEDITIPDTITLDDAVYQGCGGEYTVVEIGQRTFQEGQSIIKSVKIGKNVTSIGDGAFEMCQVLSSIELGNVKTIEGNAFSNCENLNNVVIPEGVTTISYSTFYFCRALKNLSLPESVTTIERNAFSQCTALEDFTVGDNVTSVGNYLFSDCKSLKNVTIGSGISEITEGMFSRCTSLPEINIPSNIQSIGKYAFGECESLEKVTINNIDSTIDKNAFKNCLALTSIYIPCNANVNTMFGESSGITPDDNGGYTVSNNKNTTVTGRFYRTHNIQYSADGNTITAACADCGDEKQTWTLSVTAPTEPTALEYTGSPITATLTGEITDSEIATPEIEYEAAEGSKLTDGMPVEAGTYTASITVKGVTAKVDYTITKTPSSEPDEGEEETGGADDETKNDESDDVGEPDETGNVVINSQTDDSYIKGATANISKEALLESDKFLTAEEKQELENNEKLEVTLKVSPISNISDAQRKTIADEVSSIKATSSAIHYLDLSLMKKVGTGEATAVSDPGTDISITIGIPDEMINKNAAVSREYVIIRLHVDAAGSEVDTLHGDFDEAKQ
jgi:hypothetical protein